MNEQINDKKIKRFNFLNKLYELSEGNENKTFIMWDIGDQVGLKREETEHVYQYLKGEGLLEPFALGGAIKITHYGVVQIEEALSNPEKPTHYFPPINIIYVHTMNNSQIQQGTQNSSQSLSITQNEKDRIVELIKEIRNHVSSLPDENKKDIEGDLETIEAQLKTSSPKKSIIKESLNSLRNILEQTGATVIAQKIITIMTSLNLM